jgi:hypothetical protein
MMVAIHTTTLIIKLVIINKHKDGIGSEIVGKSSDIIVRKTVSANKVVVTYDTRSPDSTGYNGSELTGVYITSRIR